MSGRTILQQEVYEQLRDQGTDEFTADLLAREIEPEEVESND